MGKFIFKYTEADNVREASSIEFTVPDGMNISEYKIVCIRMAHAMGFSEKTIKKQFGDLLYGNDNPSDIKTLINEINEG